MFASVRTYRVETGSVEDLIKELESGLVPELSKASGYQGHYVIASADGEVVSITGVQDRASIKELNRIAQGWVHQHLDRFQIREMEVTEGEVRIAHRGEPAARH